MPETGPFDMGAEAQVQIVNNPLVPCSGGWRHMHLSPDQFVTFAVFRKLPELLVGQLGNRFGAHADII